MEGIPGGALASPGETILRPYTPPDPPPLPSVVESVENDEEQEVALEARERMMHAGVQQQQPGVSPGSTVWDQREVARASFQGEPWEQAESVRVSEVHLVAGSAYPCAAPASLGMDRQVLTPRRHVAAEARLGDRLDARLGGGFEGRLEERMDSSPDCAAAAVSTPSVCLSLQVEREDSPAGGAGGVEEMDPADDLDSLSASTIGSDDSLPDRSVIQMLLLV